MFKIIEEPTFSHTVKVKVPVDGGYRIETLRATFRVLSTDRFAGHDLETEDGARNFLTEAVVRLDDVADANGQPIPWSDQLLQRVIGLPYARTALAEGYLRGVAGQAEGN